MATLADVLSMVPLFDNSLRVGNGEADEARAIIAATMAQHYFETVAATYARVLSTGVTTVAEVANTETTTWPSTLLRLDAIWLLDATTSRPIRRLNRVEEVGGHIPSLPWPLQLAMGSGVGTPNGYYANMSQFFWLPLPDSAQTLRIYGLFEQSEFATRASIFNYPLRVKPAFAAFIAKLLKASLDDDPAVIDALVTTYFSPLMRGLKQFDRSEPHGRYYGEMHDT